MGRLSGGAAGRHATPDDGAPSAVASGRGAWAPTDAAAPPAPNDLSLFLPAHACRQQTQQAQLAGADSAAVSKVADLAAGPVEAILRNGSLTKSSRAQALQQVGTGCCGACQGAAAGRVGAGLPARWPASTSAQLPGCAFAATRLPACGGRCLSLLLPCFLLASTSSSLQSLAPQGPRSPPPR